MDSLRTSYRCQASKPQLIKLELGDLPYLQRLLNHVRRTDPFSSSAAYFGMTGRKGLWLYKNDHSLMVVANHPNKNKTVLLFPPIGKAPSHLLKTALENARDLPLGKLQLARLGADDRNLLTALGKSVDQTQKEAVLDWAYPVHVVSPKTIIACEGKAFVSFRGHINRAVRHGYQTTDIAVDRDRDAILSVVEKWATDRKGSTFTQDDLTGPTRSILTMMERGALNIEGTLSKDIDGQPIGFWLWQKLGGQAVSLVRAYLKQPGNAELGILAMAQTLQSQGITEMCLGGSETAELDAFKRKMCPIRSIALETVPLDRSAPNHNSKPSWVERVPVLSGRLR
ncbi:MAG: phosphatidylglycerol lysyltransferase domain-containing protein [Hyphomicrobiales bacterium]